MPTCEYSAAHHDHHSTIDGLKSMLCTHSPEGYNNVLPLLNIQREIVVTVLMKRVELCELGCQQREEASLLSVGFQHSNVGVLCIQMYEVCVEGSGHGIIGLGQYTNWKEGANLTCVQCNWIVVTHWRAMSPLGQG